MSDKMTWSNGKVSGHKGYLMDENQNLIAQFDGDNDAEYAAHAINQHDILTNRVKVLENGLKQLALSESEAVRNHVNKLLEADNGVSGYISQK